MLNVANDMSLRLQNDVAPLDRPHHLFRPRRRGRRRWFRERERPVEMMSEVQCNSPVDLTVDLDQTLGGDGSDNL